MVDTGADVVMQQYLIVFVSLFSHYGSTYLAETCAMSPSGSCQDEAGGDIKADILLIDNKGRAV